MNKILWLFWALLAGCFFTQSAQAQSSAPFCSDPWVKAAFATWGPAPGVRPNGSGNSGECATSRFGGATWGNYKNAQAVLNAWVWNSRVCADPWIGEAFATEIGRPVNGSGTAGECNGSLYGSWSSFAQLANNIKAHLQPARVLIPALHLISAMGSKCVGVEGHNTQPGTRLILWDCLDQPDQYFKFMPNGQIQAYAGNANLCVDDQGGLMKDMDQIVVWPCNQSTSRWKLSNGHLLSTNGKCVDLRGGPQHWYIGDQDAILFTCNGQVNQSYVAGVTVPAGSSVSPLAPGMLVMISPMGPPLIISQDGNGIVAQGGGNLLATPSGIVAQGGGNITMNGGSVIVPVSGNIGN